MKKHTQIYLDFFDYGLTDFIPCEISGERAVDIHHIEARGMGGSKRSDNIQNLMGLSRQNHIKYGDKKEYAEGLKQIHTSFINNRVPWLSLHNTLPWD